MAKVINWDDLKRMHDWARIAKVGSREWINFAVTMIDSYPAMYETAKAMHKKITELNQEIERLKPEPRDIDIEDGA